MQNLRIGVIFLILIGTFGCGGSSSTGPKTKAPGRVFVFQNFKEIAKGYFLHVTYSDPTGQYFGDILVDAGEKKDLGVEFPGGTKLNLKMSIYAYGYQVTDFPVEVTVDGNKVVVVDKVGREGTGMDVRVINE